MRSREDRPFTCKFGAPLAWLRRQTRSSPPPWSVERSDACFIVRDHGGQALAYVYFEEEPGRRAAAHLCLVPERSEKCPNQPGDGGSTAVRW